MFQDQIETKYFKLKMMNEAQLFDAKQRRKAIEEEKEKHKILNLNKWDLVRARREEMIGHYNYLKSKMSRLKLVRTHVTLNRYLRILHAQFEVKKAIRKRGLTVAFSALLVARNLKRNLRRQGPNIEERMRRQLRNSIITTQNTMHEHVRLT